MPSPLMGVWELISDTDNGIRIFTETHNATIFMRQNNRRRGFISVYTVEDHRVEATFLLDTATTVPTSGALEFQRDEDTLTLHALTPGAATPAGHIDVWHKVSDLTMTSPFAGVWQLLSETNAGLNVRTDTYWAAVIEREGSRRGFAGTYTVDDNHVRHTILFDTATNASPQLDLEFQLEEGTLIVKRLARVERWRKIG